GFFGVRVHGLIQDELTFRHVSNIETHMSLGEINAGPSSFGPTVVRNRPATGRIQFAQGYGRWNSKITDWITDAMDPDKRLERYDVEILIYGPNSRQKKKIRSFILHDAYPA